MKGPMCFLTAALVLLPVHSMSQDVSEFGGWSSLDVTCNVADKAFVSLYFEHDDFEFKKLDFMYLRASAGYKLLPWLKASVGYDWVKNPTYNSNRIVAETTATLKQGQVSVSLRERYLHTYSTSNPSSDLLRSRLKVQYSIADTPFKPYLASELFTWKEWKKTRHYVGTAVSLCKYLEMDLCYMFYTFQNRVPEHVIGAGLFITL